MSNIKCPNCGNILPQGSSFCNKCGSRLDSEGGRYNNDYDDWHNDNQSRNNRKNSGSSDKTKYVLIAIGVLAFLAIVFISKKYYGGNRQKEEVQQVSIVDNSNSAAADALQRALNENNYVGDGASIVYAMRISGTEPGVNDKIIGITQLSKGEDSFYKLYELVQNGDKWSIDPDHIKQVPTNGREVTFDQNKLKAGVDMIPQVRDIDGHKYFFYAFLSTPKGDDTSNSGSVVLNLYDIETRNITSATYEGTFQNVNGEQAIVCKPASGSSEAVKWMNEQARNFIRILSISGSDQEEKKESRNDETATTQENKPAATTEAKPAPTNEPKKENTASTTTESTTAATPSTPSTPASVGEEKDKDSPMFSKDEIVETKQAGNYKVFRLKDGSVVRYDRSTGKNTKIHQGGAEAIGFEDTEKGILNIRKADGSREQVNLNNGQKTQAPPKNPAPATPAPAKTE